jgi:hypothetical protein
MSHAGTFAAMNLGSPPPPRAVAPDVEIPSFNVLSARHGLVVETLSPQLADYFGVTRGQGVLVRSVEGGSPAAAAGIKAGDVIVKVNNEVVHDMVDWQRGMHAQTNKIWVGILRDKHEQTVVMSVAGPGDNSRLEPGDWLDSDTEAQVLRDQLQPQTKRSQSEIAQLQPNDKDMEKMRREIEKSMKAQQKDLEKMSREIAKSVKPAQKEMKQMQQQIQESMKLHQKDIDKMARDSADSAKPTQQEMDEMKRHITESMPSQKDLDEMRHQIEDSMKNWTPQLQDEMQQLQKQMEQQKLDLQQMMKGFGDRQEF